MLWRRFRRHKSAFTLAELLVAMVVMSILAISVFLITSAASSTFTRGTDSITADDVKDIVMEYVKLSVRSASKVWLSNDYSASDPSGTPLIVQGNMLFVGSWQGEGATLNENGVITAIPNADSAGEVVPVGERYDGKEIIGGYVYIMPADVDGALDFKGAFSTSEEGGYAYTGGPSSLFGGYAFSPNTRSYEDHYIARLTFTPIDRIDGQHKGAAYAVRANLIITEVGGTGTGDMSYNAATGSEVISFVNLEDRGGKVQPIGDAEGGAFRYLFFA